MPADLEASKGSGVVVQSRRSGFGWWLASRVVLSCFGVFAIDAQRRLMLSSSRWPLAVALVLSAMIVESCAVVSGSGVGGGLEVHDVAPPGWATVTLVADDDPRHRSIGNIILENVDERSVATVISVELREPGNVKQVDAFLLPIESLPTRGLGVGFPVPPVPGDDEYERHIGLWDQRVAAEGGRIEPGEVFLLVPVFDQIDRSQCGSFSGVDVTYSENGQDFAAVWNTTYIFEPSGGLVDGCVDN